MPMLRAIRLLQSVEAGITLGTRELMDAAVPPRTNALSFEEYLADPGRVADLSNLLGMREQVRRMANSETTMNAIINSPVARQTTFRLTNPDSKVAAVYMANSSTAMTFLSSAEPVLSEIFDNDTAWAEFTASPYYSINVLNIVQLFAEIDVNDPSKVQDSIGDLVDNLTASSALVTHPKAMYAALADAEFITAIANSSTTMGNIMQTSEMTSIVVNIDAAIYAMVRSAVALGEINAAAKALIAATPSAIKIAMASPTWLSIITGSATIEANLRNTLVNGLDLDINLTTTQAVLEDAASAAIIAESTPAMQAILEVVSASALMIASPQLSIFMASDNAMALILPNVPIMNAIIGASAGFDAIMNNAAAKTKIFETPTLFSTMMNNAYAFGVLSGNQIVLTGPVPDTKIGDFQDLGIPGNIVLISARIGSITAAKIDNYFRSAGETAFVTAACPGTHAASDYPVINAPFTDIEWDVNSIAATAAARITVYYADFN